MRRTIIELLDECAPKGALDFGAFTSDFASTVMSRLIGASPRVITLLRDAMQAIELGVGMDRNVPGMQEGVVVMDRFVSELVAERHASPRFADTAAELRDLLLTAQCTRELTDREFADILIFLFVAGYDTSKHADADGAAAERQARSLRTLRNRSVMCAESGGGSIPRPWYRVDPARAG